jgi:GNAT superfamily N-acetyltransferase
MAERLAPDSAWRCWVAEADGAASGHLWLQLIEKVPNPGPELEVHGYITNVYVSPALRGSGTGQALMEAALAFCRERGVDSVILWPTERSRTLYARHGFVEPRDMMELVLDPGRDLH